MKTDDTSGSSLAAGCFDENAAVEFARGELAGGRRAAAAAHVDGCASCRELVSALVLAQSRPPVTPADGLTRRELADSAGGEAADAEPALGPIAVGRYVLLERLGAGGMGVVYAAYDPKLRRKIALKLVRVDAGDLPDAAAESVDRDRALEEAARARARLVREAQAMARLSHPNVIAVHDAGEAGDRVFIAMELVEGETLARWLAARVRHWREIQGVFCAAARGLAAAHAAGLIHRDFKPDNVLVAPDGRAAITDFGLARAAAAASAGHESGEGVDAARDPVAAESPADSPVTRVGVMVGTPAYMAPEQERGEPPSSRADQFSFCVALHEALWGRRPEGLPARPTSLPAARGRVPRRLRRLVARGLSADPERRHSSMDDVVRVLEAGARRRGLRAAVAAATAAAILAAAGARWTAGQEVSASSRCGDGQRELAGVWDADRKRAVERALLAQPAPYARGAWLAVERSLDRHARDWAVMRTQLCNDTAEASEPDVILALRTSCLDARRQALAQVIQVLSDPNTPVARAPQVAAGLDPVAACGDVAALSAPVPPPADPAVAARVAGLRGPLAEVKARTDAGQYAAALELVRPLIERARATGYAPIVAEAIYRSAAAEFLSGSLADAERHFYEALWAAEAGRDDDTAARAWSTLTVLVGYASGRPDEGDRIARHAEAAVARLATRSALPAAQIRAKVVAGTSSIAFARGDIARATELGAEAVTLFERAFGSDSVDLARQLINHAGNLLSLGRLDESLSTYERAARAFRVNLGDGHPDLLLIESNMAIALERLGRFDEASDKLEQSLAGAEALGAPGQRMAMRALERLADVRLAQRRPAEALPFIDRALRLRRELGVDQPMERVRTLTLRGEILRALGRKREAASLFRQALALGERALGRANPTLVYPLGALGSWAVEAGRPGPGIRWLERAVAIATGPGGDAIQAGRLQSALARALWDVGSRKRALALAGKARAGLASLAGGEKDLAELDRWLARIKKTPTTPRHRRKKRPA